MQQGGVSRQFEMPPPIFYAKQKGRKWADRMHGCDRPQIET
jgi:hypothetical protein